jgi:hypothetical protein
MNLEASSGAVRAGEMSWHTAWNVWAVVTRMFRDAANAKQRDLRARDDNPCERVVPPGRGVRVAKQVLYPSELSTCSPRPLNGPRKDPTKDPK